MLLRYRLLFLIFWIAGLSLTAQTNAPVQTSFDGFITRVTLPDSFDVGKYHILWTPKTQFWEQLGKTQRPYTGGNLHVGQAVHVDAAFQNDGITAERIVVPSDFKGPEKLSGSGFVTPSKQPSTLWVDGYPLRIDAATKITRDDGTAAASTDLRPMTWIDYEAVRNPQNVVHATSITIYPPDTTQDELEYRNSYDRPIVLPDYATHSAGNIAYSKHKKLTIFADRELQEWITQVGISLVPQAERDLPDGDPTKIQFRFFLIDHTDNSDEISSSPNGLIAVPDKLLMNLSNEAELAALLSAEIASITERYSYRDREGPHVGKYALAELGLAALSPYGALGYYEKHTARLKMNASRVGLSYMLAAGYDLASAPYAYEKAVNSANVNPRLPGSSQPDLPAMLMRDLAFDYSDVDYTVLKSNKVEYQEKLKALVAADPKLLK